MERREEPVASTDEVAYGRSVDAQEGERAPGAPPAGEGAPAGAAPEGGAPPGSAPRGGAPVGVAPGGGQPAQPQAAATAQPATPGGHPEAPPAPAGHEHGGGAAPGTAAGTAGEGHSTSATDGASGGMPLLSSGDTDAFERRWQDIQVGFVDEPRNCVQEADGLVAEVMKRLAEGFAEERRSLEGQWDRGDQVSTEDLRVALQRYRSFFNRLLSTSG